MLHNVDKYATNAAEPSPPEIFSPITVTNRKLKFGPTSDKKKKEG